MQELHPTIRFTGVDISDGMLESARKNCGPRAEFILANACDYTPQPGVFDAAITISGLLLIEQAPMIIRKLREAGIGQLCLFEGTLAAIEAGPTRLKHVMMPDRWFHSYGECAGRAGWQLQGSQLFHAMESELFVFAQ